MARSPLRWVPGKPIRIETPRFVLASLDLDLIPPELVAWRNDAALARHLGVTSGGETALSIAAMVRKGRAERTLDLLVLLHDDRPIGYFVVEVAPIDLRATTHHVIGARAWWGKGVVHEARGCLIETLFRARYEKITGTPLAANRAAVRTYEEQGFTLEGRLRGHVCDNDGNRLDVCQFGMLRADWQFERACRPPEAVRRRMARLAARRIAAS